jgi:hypothetical protein
MVDLPNTVRDIFFKAIKASEDYPNVQWYIAGSYALWCYELDHLFDCDWEPNDIDLYVTTSDPGFFSFALIEILGDVFGADKIASDNYSYYGLTTFRVEVNGYNFNIIPTVYKNAAEILESFDLPICKVAIVLDGTEFKYATTPDFLQSYHDRGFVQYYTEGMPEKPNLMSRIEKYRSRGYNIVRTSCIPCGYHLEPLMNPFSLIEDRKQTGYFKVVLDPQP